MTSRLYRLAAAILAAGAASIAVAGEAVSPIGTWQLSTGESRYAVVSCGGDAICARLTWLREDVRTPENMALLNTIVVRGRPVRADRWQGTAIYEGDTVEASMVMLDDDTMKLTGCQFLCRTMTLARVGNEVASR